MASIGQELLNVPMGDMIRDMAFAIAEAQFRLDENAVEVAEMMGGLRTIYNDEGEVSFDDSRVFFGREYMTIKDAAAFAVADDALTGGEVGIKMVDIIQKVQEKLEITDEESEIPVPLRVSMLELGFTPAFYQFVDTIIEVKIAIKITRTRSFTRTTKDTERETENTSERSRRRPGFFSAIFSSSNRRSSESKNTSKVQTSQVDASYSSKYSYSAEGASLLRTKLSPVPPPPILEERIRAIIDDEQERRELRLEAERKRKGLPPFDQPGGGG